MLRNEWWIGKHYAKHIRIYGNIARISFLCSIVFSKMVPLIGFRHLYAIEFVLQPIVDIVREICWRTVTHSHICKSVVNVRIIYTTLSDLLSKSRRKSIWDNNNHDSNALVIQYLQNKVALNMGSQRFILQHCSCIDNSVIKKLCKNYHVICETYVRVFCFAQILNVHIQYTSIP